MALFGSNINNDVVKILNKRIELQSQKDNDSYLKWNSRIPWIKLFSNVIPMNDKLPKNLAESYILEGTVVSNDGTFDKSYAMIDDIPLRPTPIIQTATISSRGKYGSIRIAELNIVCFTRDQLTNIETLYMTPGTTCVLQWGWTVDQFGNINVESGIEYDDGVEKLTNEELPDLIRGFRKNTNYSSDIMMGYVTDFGWSMNTNGTFSCKVKLTARGFEAAFRKIEDSLDVDIADGKKQNIKSFVETLKNKCSDSDYVDSIKDFKPVEIKKLFGGSTYVPIGFIENHIIKPFVTRGSDKNSISVFESTNTNKFTREKSEVLIRNHSKLRSLDYKKFIIPGNPVGIIGAKNFVNILAKDKSVGVVRNILINLDTVVEIFTNSETIMDAINSLLDMLNQYSARYWNLILLPDTEEGKCKIIDSRWLQNEISENKDKLFMFPVYKYDSIVKNIDVASNIPDTFKTAALHSLHSDRSENLSIEGLFGDVEDRLLKQIREENSVKTIEKADYKGSIEYKQNEKKLNKLLLKKRHTHKAIIPEVMWEYYKNLLDEPDSNYNNRISNNRLLPISMGLTIDGISGLEFGNLFSVDYLPERYEKNNIAFQITEVVDKIDASKWDTEIAGIMRFGLDVDANGDNL